MGTFMVFHKNILCVFHVFNNIPPLEYSRFKGNYEGHECLIEVENVRPEDVGQWKCEMESYVWGISRGTVKKQAIEVEVVPRNSEGTTTG